MRCTCLTGTEVGITVHSEIPSGPFIRVHILMSQTQKKRQEARSALNTVISSSKRRTRVSSTSPPLAHPSLHTQFLSSSNNPGGGWGLASPGSTHGEHWWQGGWWASFVACLAPPCAGQWLNQGPGVRPSAGAAVVSYPQWAWMCPWEEMLQSACYLFAEFIVILAPSHVVFFLPWGKYITHWCPIPAQNLKLLFSSWWISNIRAGLMLLTDILRMALGREEKAFCKGDKNHKKVISSQRDGVKALWLIFFACILGHMSDLIKKFSFNPIFIKTTEPWKLLKVP